MSGLLSFMVVIFFVFVVGFGALFLTTSAFCGEELGACGDSVDAFGYPFSGYGYPFSGYGESDNGNCGYPGVTFTCADGLNKPVLNVSNNIYHILSNHQGDKYLIVVGVDVEEDECPRPMYNFTLPTTSSFSDPYKNSLKLTYFYNCSSGYPKDVEQGLPCLDTYYNTTTTPGLRSFAFSDLSFNSSAFEEFNRSADERFNWFTRNCQKSVVVPNTYFDGDFKKSLKLGIYLEWSTPEECKDCEKSGGQCWFNHTTAGVLHYACSCPQNGTTDERKLFDKVCHPIQNTPQQQGPTTISHRGSSHH